MGFYYAMTYYQLLECILHKIVFNKDKKAVLYLSDFLTNDNHSIVQCIKKTGPFEDVAVFKETIFSHEDNIDLEKEIQRICELVKKENSDLAKGFDSYYVGQDVDALGVYLVTNKIKYHFFEDASGSYSHRELLMNIIRDENENRFKIVNVLKLGGRSDYVIDIYCDFENQEKGFNQTKCIDYSVKNLLKKLDEVSINRILQIFHCKKYGLSKKKKSLLLTWHYNNMGFMTLDEQRQFFTLLADYFTEESEQLFIKPHPSDRCSDYQSWFKNAVVLERYMPAELLPFLIDDKFETGITNWSTSIFGLRGILKNIINFDKDIDKTYCDFNRYYAVVVYLRSIKKDNKRQKIRLVNINEVQLLQLAKYYFKDYEKYYRIVDSDCDIVIADRWVKELNGKKSILMNKSSDCMFSSVLWVKYGSTNEYVYLYDMPEKEFSLEKKMNYSGGTLYVDLLSLPKFVNSLETRLIEEGQRIGQLKKEKQDKQDKIDELSDIIDKNREMIQGLRGEVEGMVNSLSWKITEPLRKLNSVRKKYEKG